MGYRTDSGKQTKSYGREDESVAHYFSTDCATLSGTLMSSGGPNEKIPQMLKTLHSFFSRHKVLYGQADAEL